VLIALGWKRVGVKARAMQLFGLLCGAVIPLI
jgi:hypothetical protein